LEVPIITDQGALPDGSQFWVLGAREEGGALELVGTAETAEEAKEMARAVIEGKGWVHAFLAGQLLSYTVDLAQVEQVKHGAGYYFIKRKKDE
jgi:hypothetical protein